MGAVVSPASSADVAPGSPIANRPATRQGPLHSRDENAWEKSRLEYRFACSAPQGDTRKTIVADEYYRSDLDWWAFDVDAAAPAAAVRPEVEASVTSTFIPTALEFNGMANPSWWSFEDSRVNFGAVTPDTTDLAKLLLLDFALLYTNDWFLIPVPLAAGAIAEVQGLVVTNVFGERLGIDAAGQAQEHAWQRWRMFRLDQAGGIRARRSDQALLMLPTVPKVQEGMPIEEFTLIRDEMANTVWGIESTVPLVHGLGRAGSGAAAETRAFHQRAVGTPPPCGAPPRERGTRAL